MAKMKQCETCIDSKLKEETLACQIHHLYAAFQECLQSIPFFGKYVKDYHCKDYEENRFDLGIRHPMCRCHFEPVFEGEKDV